LQTVGVICNTEPTASRTTPGGGFLLFYLDAEQRLQGACGWGQGNSVAKDIKLCERLIANGNSLSVDALADAEVSLKQLLRN
jgi:hypothetical protein